MADLKVGVYDAAGQVRGKHTRQVVWDADADGLQDGWEAAAVAEFAAQYGIGFTVPTLQAFPGGFFGPTNEFADPDRENADGSRDLGTHKTAGDSLSVFQEYRGFILDGGGFDGAGQNGHAGGHKRLSPAFKEYLWEVDYMQGIQHVPAGGIEPVLAAVAKDYADKDRGAGIRVYWVNSELQTPHQVFRDPVNPLTATDRHDYANAHRDPLLKPEFIHVMFVDNHTGNASIRGQAGGSSGVVTIYIEKVWNWINPRGYDHVKNLRWTIAHETTHILLNEKNSHGFDAGEHLIDPDEDGDTTSNEAGDAPEVMYRFSNATNNNSPPIWFDPTLRRLDLTSKEGVER